MNPDRLDILQRAANLLVSGDAIAAKSWLSEPTAGLDGKTPIEYGTTVDKTCEVLELIGRIKHGVFW
ncbi:MAG: antitoxin Xre/MbcA/ParS toxin-binding domain-containing protein [Neptuniibacter sp.]